MDRKKLLTLLGGGIVGLMALGLIIYAIIDATTLRLVATRPANNGQTNVTTNIVFTYNKPLSKDTLRHFSLQPSVNGKLEIKDKSLVFTPSTSLNNDAGYTATVAKAISADRAFTAGSASIRFTANILEGVSDDVMQEEIKKVDSYEPDFQGMNALLDQGVTSSQIDALQTALPRFKKAKHFDVDYNSVKSVPFNPGSTEFTLEFDIKINDTPYKATLKYFDITKIRLFLKDEKGKQVFDSKNVDTSESTGSEQPGA
ncbi:hypothetical protein TM7_0045 [candidate division TM7 genomosp. GTL1]|nr:hypothetical protein TM7_0056 [candidate division TM7 genomosp. GTL1]EDK72786.1 hypothetical protein TM7_0061 [candidate division TM7 genomosp. GTL1]EDK72795.1 hypothetical protein TM7_0045 [candidate division TM7 genomosp. GTL1]